MTTTSHLQKNPDFYTTIDDCKNAKRKKDIQTNPRYKEYKQTHFTAGDEDQFQEYRDLTNGDVCIHNIELDDNKFRDIDFSSILDWNKYQNINATSVNNTFNYLFHKFKKGTFVKIQNNQLKVFLPFSKKNFVNEWSNKIKVDPSFKGHNFSSSMQNFAQHINKLSGTTYRISVNSFPENWYSNNCLVRYEYPINEGDSNVSNISDMLKTLCATRKIPDIEFFMNRRDFPQLMRDGTEAYEHLFGDGQQLLSHNYDKYSPLLSMVTTKNHADIPVPTGEDWSRISSQESKFFSECREYPTPDKFSIQWKDRKPTAVFRGASTGCGVTIDTNIRLKLAYISVNTPPDIEGPLLDAGISKWQLRPRKLKNEEYLKTIDVNDLNKKGIKIASFLTPIQQSEYKYLIHVDGHVSAFRLSLEMSMGCCILLADSKYKLWFRDMLWPLVHYVPVKEDLSDLVDQIKWCRKHDKECEEIASNAKNFYLKYLNKDGILDYMQKLLIDLKNRTGVYFYNTQNPLQIQLKYELYKNNKKKYPTTTKTINDIGNVFNTSRSIGLLKGIEWIVNMVNNLSSFCDVAKKENQIFSNSSKTIFVDKYKLAGCTFVVKSTTDIQKIQENIHESFIGTKVINELVKYSPNFAYIFGSSTNNVIMEYIKGLTFSQWIQSKAFNIHDFIFILIQLAFALEFAQRNYSFVHYDLTPWNIIIYELKDPVNFDYMFDEKNIYRVNTKIIPVIIDYGKSHVVYKNIHYGYINMFKMSTIQDIVSILVTSINDITQLENLSKTDVNDLINISNFLAGTGYRKQVFKQTGHDGLSDIRFFVKKNKKYAELISSNKYELEQKTPLDFVNYITKTFSYKFTFEKTELPTFIINKGNPKQVFEFILSSNIDDKINSFLNVFERVNKCNLPPTKDLVLIYYTVQTLEGNIKSVWQIMKSFLEKESISIDPYIKIYNDTLDNIKNIYKQKLSELKLKDDSKYTPTHIFDTLEQIPYTIDSFLEPNIISSYIDKYKNIQLQTYLYEYKNIIKHIIVNQGYFKLDNETQKVIKNTFRKLLETKCLNINVNTANICTLFYMSKNIYTQDKNFLIKNLPSTKQIEQEKIDCSSITETMKTYNKILNIKDDTKSPDIA